MPSVSESVPTFIAHDQLQLRHEVEEWRVLAVHVVAQDQQRRHAGVPDWRVIMVMTIQERCGKVRETERYAIPVKVLMVCSALVDVSPPAPPPDPRTTRGFSVTCCVT